MYNFWHTSNQLKAYKIFMFGILLLLPKDSMANEIIEPSSPLGQENGTDSHFEYAIEGRPDPFVPFIKDKVATSILDPNEIIEPDLGRLTGMQLFEPGQLTLVATLFSNKKPMAMVEDVTGKGYIISDGTLIGAIGKVTNITPQEVIITETSRTRAGKELKNTIVMRLKKEGDQ